MSTLAGVLLLLRRLGSQDIGKVLFVFKNYLTCKASKDVLFWITASGTEQDSGTSGPHTVISGISFNPCFGTHEF